MTTLTYYHIALVTHITGLTIMAGSTLVDSILSRQFWKQYINDKMRAIAINEAVAKYQMLFGIGMILLIISGIVMMALTNGVFGEQTWFRIKFGLILLVIINGLAVGRRQGVKLRKLLSVTVPGQDVESKISKIKSRLYGFHVSQLIFFLIIFILSVFKFN
jgi:type IV secretory pathway TrbD component